MEIVAICNTPFDFAVVSFGTLARMIRRGAKVSLVIVDKIRTGKVLKHKMAEVLKTSSGYIGLSNIHLVENEFDYSAVTQENVNTIRSYVEGIDPALVIMPYIESSDDRQRKLGASCLLAARSVRNVLMYELDSKSSNFVPNMYFELAQQELDAKMRSLRSFISDLGRNKPKKKITIESIHRSYSKKVNTSKPVEAFQSHRVVLGNDTLFF